MDSLKQVIENPHANSVKIVEVSKEYIKNYKGSKLKLWRYRIKITRTNFTTESSMYNDTETTLLLYPEEMAEYRAILEKAMLFIDEIK